MSDPIVGIDLGTSNSVIAHADATGSVKVFADDSGGKVHPSVVSFHPNGGVVVGAAAKQRKVIDPQNTIYSVKRLIGRAYRSPEVQTAKLRSPFLIKEGPNAAPIIATRAGEFAVPEISAIVLDHVRNIAAARLATPVNRAVVTVPASFNDAQRSATATAGAIAGLTVVRVLNEPTAAALAYGHTRQLREIIAVYDFGGGTFDITLLRLDDQVYEVLGTSGDTFLGGDDLDERLVDKMVTKFLAENRIDLRTNEVSMMRLRAVAEQTKIELSRRSRAVVRVDEIAYGPRGAPLNLQIEISRDEFVHEVADIIDRTFPVCTEALALANLSIDRIADVILVGGTTKIPYVRDKVSQFFGKAARIDVNPEDAVAAGAALQATSLERILSRRTSSKMPVVQARPDGEAASGNEVLELADPDSGAMMAPSELTLAAAAAPDRAKRTTAGYAEEARSPTSDPTRPDTSYSVTRAGVRDEVADPERYPGAPVRLPGAATATPRPMPVVAPPSGAGGFETRTPTTMTQPLGRITRPVPEVPPPHQAQTMLGAPADIPTEIDIELSSAGVPVAGDASPSRPVTSIGPAIPPPVPRNAMRPGPPARPPPSIMATTQMPAIQRPPGRTHEPSQAPRSGLIDVPDPAGAPRGRDVLDPQDWTGDDSSAGTQPVAWAMDSLDSPMNSPPTVTPAPQLFAQNYPPRAPQAPPNAPTLIGMQPFPERPAASAATPPVVRGPGAPTLIAESAATTPRAFQAPQSFPIQPAIQPLAAPLPAPPRPPPVVLEVTPRSLGIATVAGFCEELIKRNARLPTEAKRLFTTSRDLQDLVRIVVCQGESRRLDNNTIIGDLVLQNLPPRPRGETSIEVTFALDASGILHVRARDAQTGTEQRVSLALVGDVAAADVAVSRDRLQQLRR